MDIRILLAFSILCLLASIIAYFKVRNSKNEVGFTWAWSVFIGAFCWEDILIYGLLHSIIAGFAYYQGSIDLWLIYYFTFWVIRSAGETIYFFLQQFIQPKHHPHNIHKQFFILKKLIGNVSDQKAFILLQIIHQSIVVISLIILYNLF